MNRALLIILFCVMLPQMSICKMYRFDNLTSSDGLGDNFVRRVFVDSYGFIWVATKDGLSRYDGYDFKTFKQNSDYVYELNSAYIADIKEDSDRNMWVGTGEGIAFFDRKKEQFVNYALNDTLNVKVFDLIMDADTLWIASQDGLCRFNIRSKEYIWYFTKSTNWPIDNNYTRINRIQKDKDGVIWIGFASENGLVAFNTYNETYTRYMHLPGQDTTARSLVVRGMDFINDSVLVISCLGIGATAFNVRSLEWFVIDNSHSKNENGLNMTWCAFADSKENIWIGSINGGLFRFDKDLKFIDNLLPDDEIHSGLNSASISSIVEDKHGNLWFGTHGGGLNVLYQRKKQFNHYKKLDSELGLQHDFVSCFYELSPDTILIGTDGGGMSLFYKNENRFKHFTIDDGLSSNSVLSISYYDKDTLAISTWEGGVMFFNFKDYSVRTIRHDPEDPNSINYPYLKSATSKGDSLYIVTHAMGLNIYNRNTHKFINSTNSPEYAYLLNPESGNEAMFDNEGNLWVATTGGLFRLESEVMYQYLPDASDSSSISNVYITDIFVDSKDRVWFGSLDGINLYNKSDDSFIKFSEIPELDRAIMSICEDNYGNLWLGANTGLIRFNFDSKDVYLFDENDGLQGNQFFERAAYKDSEGIMYFGGMNGFNSFDPSLIVNDTIVPDVFINDFKIYYQSQHPSDSNSVISKHINFCDNVHIDYDQKVISIDYTGLHLLASAKNEYKYKLEGFDNNWYSVENVRTATYTNLSPGKYVFRVKACNADKVWTKKSKNLTIIIDPPWWLTWWFRLLSGVVFVAIIVLIFYVRTRNIKRINKLLEEKVKQRTHELLVANNKLQETINTKDRFFNIIAHDLKNPLNSMLGFSELMLKNWEGFAEHKKHHFINIIHTSSQQLYSLLVNLLDWSRSQTGNIKVDMTVLTLLPQVAQNILLLKGQAQVKDIKLSYDISDKILVVADENILNTILRNLISNAIKYTAKQGNIAVSAIVNHSYVEIRVVDNGVGMTKEQVSKLFKVNENISTPGTEKEKGTGLGLLLCYELIKKINGGLNVESNVGEGTSFIITLPVA